uniref:Uncharacterized protein n=1 Tax=Calcidiscus leptoporus TaxID=127549 RepID=A0A7S0JJN3_9EUKA
MMSEADARRHRVVTDAVHAHDGAKIAMQILHTGRYSYSPTLVAPSKRRAPINFFSPRALSGTDVERTIGDFVRCAALAEEAGYDGVEVMGSEGYLINQFIAKRTNHRTDEWGGSYENRMRLPVRIVEGIREATHKDFLIVYRLSMLDLVEEGSTWEEIISLAQAIEVAGASIINTGIGWHEARVPTIATSVPRAAFSWVTGKLMGRVSVPLVATNRINTPEVAESVLESGEADMISMARPLLADPDFVNKAAAGTPERINTCIGCNQACLDHVFSMKPASCLVNPRAGQETELNYTQTSTPMSIAVVGAGPAGLACSTTAARRGHQVTLFDAAAVIGGQFNLAKQVPGKEEFYETIRYFSHELSDAGVKLRLSTLATEEMLLSGSFDAVVLATGVRPRALNIRGADHAKVVSYVDVLNRTARVGQRVAVVGAGGIGFDVAEFLLHGADSTPAGTDAPSALPQRVDDFLCEWNIDRQVSNSGGLVKARDAGANGSEHVGSSRKIYLLQRKKGKHGAGLGKTTGWIHRSVLKKGGVQMIGGVSYSHVDDDGLHLKRQTGGVQTLEVDTVVVCAGQTSYAPLETSLQAAGMPTFKIGGAHLASELDAKRAIDQGARLAAQIESAAPERVGELVAALPLQAWLYDKIVLSRQR